MWASASIVIGTVTGSVSSRDLARRQVLAPAVEKAKQDVAARVLPGAASAGDAERGPLGEPPCTDAAAAARRWRRCTMIDPAPAAASEQGPVGVGHHVVGDHAPDRGARDGQPLAPPVVGLHEHADGVAAVLGATTRREAVPIPPLKPWQIIPVPPPTAPSATGSAVAA